MIDVDIPGFGRLRIAHLVLDYNGTLARDGVLLEGVADLLRALAALFKIHVVTADTFGSVREQMGALPCEIVVLPAAEQDAAKERYVRSLGSGETTAVGNGRNDARMLAEAALGIAVIQDEGAAAAALRTADIVCLDIRRALELLIHRGRLTATLRS